MSGDEWGTETRRARIFAPLTYDFAFSCQRGSVQGSLLFYLLQTTGSISKRHLEPIWPPQKIGPRLSWNAAHSFRQFKCAQYHTRDYDTGPTEIFYRLRCFTGRPVFAAPSRDCIRGLCTVAGAHRDEGDT